MLIWSLDSVTSQIFIFQSCQYSLEEGFALPLCDQTEVHTKCLFGSRCPWHPGTLTKPPIGCHNTLCTSQFGKCQPTGPAFGAFSKLLLSVVWTVTTAEKCCPQCCAEDNCSSRFPSGCAAAVLACLHATDSSTCWYVSKPFKLPIRSDGQLAIRVRLPRLCSTKCLNNYWGANPGPCFAKCYLQGR